MLQELHVHNLALVDALQLDFSGCPTGLIVFTGETGAGKSIILQALHLLTGGRGSSTWVRSGCEQAYIDAAFGMDERDTAVQSLLSDHGLENGGNCLLRRALNSKGRSRFYVNDRLATSRLMGQLTENFLNIAGQHDHQQLLNVRSHLDFIDSFGECWDLRQEVNRLFHRWQKLSRELLDVQGREQDKEQRRDFLQYQLNEIRVAEIVDGEDEELLRERNRLKSSGTLASLAQDSVRLLDGGASEDLSVIRKNMEQVASIDPVVAELSERVSSLCFELEDIAEGVKNYRNSIPMDPKRLDTISDRLTLLKQLQRKYGVTLEDVLSFARRAEEELASLDSLDEEIERLARVLEKVRIDLVEKAVQLSAERRTAADKLTKSLCRELASLHFPQAVFEVSLSCGQAVDMANMQASGLDRVEFLFSANPGEPVKPLAKIASGGELSRLMLAMKCLLARRDHVHTVVFDEVDAGLGGQAAEAVAQKINELATHHQVFCITHLPQIAAYADEHFLVAKKVENGRTCSTIAQLGNQERILELGRMLGGDQPTEQTLAYARELVEKKGLMRKKQ